jgi:FkbH-like protein
MMPAAPGTTSGAPVRSQAAIAVPMRIARTDRVVTIGTGFAREVARCLRARGFRYLVTESAHPILPEQTADALHYGEQSARYGDVPTARQFLQLVRRAYGRFAPVDDVWRRGDRYVDPFRPSIQPNGFASWRECDRDRLQHLAAVRHAFDTMDACVVTVAATDCWTSRIDGAAYPIDPAQVLGVSDPHQYVYRSFSAEEVIGDLRDAIAEIRQANPPVRVLIAVAPTPPDDERHATRAAVARLCARRSDGTGYFPLFELAEDHASLDDALRLFARHVLEADAAPAIAEPSADPFLDTMDEVVRAVCDDEWPGRSIKCVVWDLDDTLWDGVLLEGEPVGLRDGIRTILETLDRRGILSSIASRNDRDTALAQLAALGINEYFVCPQITWGSKAAAIRRLARALNIGTDAIAFVDDQPFERDEVSELLPEVTCLDVTAIDTLLDRSDMQPPVVTVDARQRRLRYQRDLERQEAEQAFDGPREAFLATLGGVCTIARATVEDLPRAKELVERTHQLNSTGRRYSLDQLDAFRTSPDHRLLVARFEDRYGSYGTIGLCAVTCGRERWTIPLLLMSCRVITRGPSAVLLLHVMQLAKQAGARLCAELVPTGRNALMQRLFADAGLLEGESCDGARVFESALDRIPSFPPYLQGRVTDEDLCRSL